MHSLTNSPIKHMNAGNVFKNTEAKGHKKVKHKIFFILINCLHHLSKP